MSARLRLDAAVLAIVALFSVARPAMAADGRTLDAFADITAWHAVASDDVSAALSRSESPVGGALRLSFDFRDHAGYVVAHRALGLEPPANFEITFRLRGEARPNDFQLKLIDASGDNVWWFRRADYEFSPDWKTVRVRSRQIEFAWGPIADHRLRSVAAIEFVVATGSGGGAGSIEIADLVLRPLPLLPATWPTPVVTASASDSMLTIDLGVEREFGAVTLHWVEGHAASAYDLQFSDDGSQWTTVREVRNATTNDQPLFLPESATRFLRLRLPPAGAKNFELKEFTLEPLEVGASPSQFLSKVAQGAPRGAFPRAYVGEQSYWTVVGTDVGRDEGLLSEDAAFELRKRSPALEPFVRVDGALYDWATVTSHTSLKDRYLPIPSVTWTHESWQLVTTAFASGAADREFAVVRYDYENKSDRQQAVTLAIAVRPMQVNPPTQVLNGAGGFAAVRTLDWDGWQLRINREQTVTPLTPPDDFAAATFESAPRPADLLERRALAAHVSDALGFASGAFLYHRQVPGHGRFTVALLVPWSQDAAPAPEPAHAEEWLREQEAQVAAHWHASLDRVELKGPPQAQPVFDTLRTALAHILVNRDGPQLQPGSRSYERSWIRDGALESEALLRLGHAQDARDFLDWYSKFLFSNGKVPCCVDGRGADPVPENDSNGEFLWLAGELDRYTHDRTALDRIGPSIDAASRYLDQLRQTERTPEILASERRAFYGMLPASISHEGYSAKPMHSYWDDFWALAGLQSGAALARTHGDAALEAQMTAASRQFRSDLYASLSASMTQHRISYLPGAAELGDFDATSTTIALAPVGETSNLPVKDLNNTFERYWQEFKARRDGTLASAAYTPYEIRTIGSFIRLGWASRANELLSFFMHDRRPAAWNQWAEVVGKDPREPRFIGDMPHGWVASDFIRSALDLFAYEREADASLVLAAGIDPQWLDGAGIAVNALRTPWGRLSYSLRREKPGVLRLHIDRGVTPPGGVVLRVDGTEHRFRELPVDTTIEERSAD